MNKWNIIPGQLPSGKLPFGRSTVVITDVATLYLEGIGFSVGLCLKFVKCCNEELFGLWRIIEFEGDEMEKRMRFK